MRCSRQTPAHSHRTAPRAHLTTTTLTSRRLALLNTTVVQMAKSVNQVLTMAYRDIYVEDDVDDDVQLELLTAPLAATEEVIQLYASGLAPLEIAMPACLHSIGATREQIAKSVESAIREKDTQKECSCEESNFSKREREAQFSEREENRRITSEKAELDKELLRANIAKMQKETSVLRPKPDASSGSAPMAH